MGLWLKEGDEPYWASVGLSKPLVRGRALLRL